MAACPRTSADLRAIFEELERSIRAELKAPEVTQLELFSNTEREKFERNRSSLEKRLQQLPVELEQEIAAIRGRYADPTPRLFPVAVTYLIPQSYARQGYVMPRFTIRFDEATKEHFGCLSATQRSLVLSGIKSQLADEPLIETRNRKRLRPNPVAPWELRLGGLRVSYEVVPDEPEAGRILAVGKKEGNRLIIGRKEIQIGRKEIQL
jgi:hypothetical protein